MKRNLLLRSIWDGLNFFHPTHAACIGQHHLLFQLFHIHQTEDLIQPPCITQDNNPQLSYRTIVIDKLSFFL